MYRDSISGWVLAVAIVIAAGASVWGASAAAGGPVTLRHGEAELFLDDHLVARSENVRFALQQMEKSAINPVLKADRPWEGPGFAITPSVLVDPQTGRFRMYYGTMHKGDRVCYAESDDGIHWVKPPLGLHPFGAEVQTNIVLPKADSFWVILNPDPRAPADRRYLGWVGIERGRPPIHKHITTGGRSLGYVSGDGIHWQFLMETWHGRDTFTSFVWCPEDQRFRAYCRGWRAHQDYAKTRFDPKERTQFRTVQIMESSDFLDWTEPRLLFETSEAEGAPLVQTYGLAVRRYGNGYVGALSVLYIDQSVEGWHRGHQNTQLAFSRDGVSWNRVANRSVFIEHGPAGAFDWGQAYYSGGVFAHGDKTYCYYTSKSALHKGPGEYAIGLATLPRDRLMALSPEDLARPGVIETRAFRCQARQLLVNTSGTGVVQVEVLDERGNPMPPFLAGASRVAPADAIYQRVTWTVGSQSRTLADLGAELDKGVRLRFRLDRVRLHSFKVSD